MAYRYDPDLEFLGTLSSEELNDLVDLLIYDQKEKSNSNVENNLESKLAAVAIAPFDVGSLAKNLVSNFTKKRFTESLTSNEKYKKYKNDHSRYWQEIAEEVQLFGGNTLMNLAKGNRGVLYKEILCDVCDKMKVNYNKYSATTKIEQNLLMKILDDSLENMSPEEIKNLATELGLDNKAFATPQALQAAFLTVFKLGGFKSYQLTLIIVNAVMKAVVGKGLTLAGNAALTKAASILTGPIGWTITGIWTAIDLAGPAYRVTIPAVIEIAYLRSLAENRQAIDLAEQINF